MNDLYKFTVSELHEAFEANLPEYTAYNAAEKLLCLYTNGIVSTEEMEYCAKEIFKEQSSASIDAEVSGTFNFIVSNADELINVIKGIDDDLYAKEIEESE